MLDMDNAMKAQLEKEVNKLRKEHEGHTQLEALKTRVTREFETQFSVEKLEYSSLHKDKMNAEALKQMQGKVQQVTAVAAVEKLILAEVEDIERVDAALKELEGPDGHLVGDEGTRSFKVWTNGKLWLAGLQPGECEHCKQTMMHKLIKEHEETCICRYNFITQSAVCKNTPSTYGSKDLRCSTA